MARLAALACADEVPSPQLPYVEPLLSDMLDVEHLGGLFPSAILVCSLDIRLTPERVDVGFLEGVRPFAAVTDEYGIGRVGVAVAKRRSPQSDGRFEVL